MNEFTLVNSLYVFYKLNMSYQYLFFDVETTGIDAEWDHIVQLAAILTDDTGKELSSINHIIKPDGFVIPRSSTAIHGISQAKAMKEGISISTALAEFVQLLTRADVLVAHNYSFDVSFVSSELEKNDMGTESLAMNLKPYICTMLTTTKFVGLNYNPKYKSYKWPKLMELYYKLFESVFDGAHDALVDVKATAKCFFELKAKHGFYSTV